MNTQSNRSAVLQRILSGLLTAYFVFCMWTLYAIGGQANLVKLRVFLVSLLLLFILERLFYHGQEGTGKRSGGWLRFFILYTWYSLLITCLLFYLWHPLDNRFGFMCGLVLISLGLGMRLWSVHVLGKYFSTQVEIWQGQIVVESGPYRYIRHPAYLGSLLMAIGYPLFMNTWGVLFLSMIFILLLILRIREEEAVLQEQLSGYTAYCLRTKRLLPGVW